MDAPAESFQHLLAQAVAVPSRLCGVVHGAIALDAERVLTRLVGVAHRHVDPVSGSPDLRVDLVAHATDDVDDVLLEGALGHLVVGPRVDRERADAPVSEVEVRLQVRHPVLVGVRPGKSSFVMSLARMDEMISTRRRARVMATLSRRQPPFLFRGPKFIVSLPNSSRP